MGKTVLFCSTGGAIPEEAGRQAHLSGRVAAALMAKASEFLTFCHGTSDQ